MRLPPVDPTKPRRVRKRLLEPIALTDAGRWYTINVAPRIDRSIGRLTGARVTSVPGVPLLLLTHTGAKSGREYITPLLYFTDGDGDVVTIASNYGRERHPAWLANVKANPDVRLQAKGRSGRYRARVVASGPERDRLFGLAKQLTRAYASYEQRVGDDRTIQVVVLTPLDPA